MAASKPSTASGRTVYDVSTSTGPSSGSGSSTRFGVAQVRVIVRSTVPVPGSSGSQVVLAATRARRAAEATSAAVVENRWATSPQRKDPAAMVPMKTRM
jgi:hypothetical protein